MYKKHGRLFLSKGAEDAFSEGLKKIEEEYQGININLNERWEEGIEHHPKSIKIMEEIAEVDFWFNSDYFRWKTGDYGDNGESLLYILDIIFEKNEAENKK